MSVGPRITGVLLILTATLVQVSIISRIEVGDASPDLLILVVASLALLSGSVPGAAYGFLAGVTLATFAALPLGPHALLGTLAGYAIGRVGEALVTDEHPAPPLLAGIFATILMHVGRPLVEFLVNPGSQVVNVWSHALVVTVISSVLAVPVYVLVRRLLIVSQDASGAISEATTS